MTSLDTIKDRLSTLGSKPSIHLEKPGVISDGPCWVIIWGCHMYCGETLLELAWDLVWNFADSSSFVGF